MKSYKLFGRLTRHFGRRLRHVIQTRRGTVIIVVLALLGMLALLGFFILSITGSENQAATYFAGASKVNAPAAANADTFFDSILRQIIIGPAITEKQSALWGGNKSLLPTMFGRDMAPFNGPGVNLIWNTTTNLPAIDQNYDTTPDTVTAGQPNLMQLNFSPAAQGVLLPTSSPPVDFNNFSTDIPPFPGSTSGKGPFPDPDTNITYPDINNAFLASDTLVPNGLNNPVRVITPSFHRPMLLRNAAAFGGGTVTTSQWYTNKNTAALVLFPHTEHLAIDNSGTLTSTHRFVSNAYPDNVSSAPNWAASTAYAAGQMVNATPASAANPNTYVCTVGGTSGGTQPTWPTLTGATVNDGTVVWSNTSLQPFSIPGDNGIPPQEGVWTPDATWAASTNYSLGAIVTPSTPNGRAYLCTAAGTTGTATPVWSNTTGATVADGSVVWTDIGLTINYDVDTDNDGVPDARYMDFGFPLMTTPDGSQQFVAMGSVEDYRGRLAL